MMKKLGMLAVALSAFLVGCGGSANSVTHARGVNMMSNSGTSTTYSITNSGVSLLSGAGYLGSASYTTVPSEYVSPILVTDASSNTIASGTADMVGGGYETIVVGPNTTSPQIFTITDDTSTVASTQARIQIVDMTTLGTVDVYLVPAGTTDLTGATAIQTGVTLGWAGTRVIVPSASTSQIWFTSPGDSSTVLLKSTSFGLAAGDNVTVLVGNTVNSVNTVRLSNN